MPWIISVPKVLGNIVLIYSIKQHKSLDFFNFLKLMRHVFVLCFVLKVGLKVNFGFLLHAMSLDKAIHMQSLMSLLLLPLEMRRLTIVLLKVFELELLSLD